ncbi:hypothetical protein ACJZ2D_009908 [Fusarium nematophilum]
MGLPLDNISSEENRHNPLPRIVEQCRSDLTNRVEEVLGRNGLHEVDIDFLYRQIPKEPETAALALLICPDSVKYDKTRWENSVRSLKTLVDGYFAARGRPDLNLSVELTDSSLLSRKHCGRLEDDDPFLSEAWSDSLLPSIDAIVKLATGLGENFHDCRPDFEARRQNDDQNYRNRTVQLR